MHIDLFLVTTSRRESKIGVGKTKGDTTFHHVSMLFYEAALLL